MKQLILTLSTLITPNEDIESIKHNLNLDRWEIECERLEDITMLRRVTIDLPSATTDDIRWLNHLVTQGEVIKFNMMERRVYIGDIQVYEEDLKDPKPIILKNITAIPPNLLRECIIRVDNEIV